ncbi:MAG: DUF3237 domain-containing protein [Proteobacteria bacterium]|nr:DUF3237 domain-containing protein [Pseudomonadota bacterium]
MPGYGFKFELEHVTSYNALLAPPEMIGPVAEGLRLNAFVTGGKVAGPKLNGQFLPGGGDWLTVRTDGIAVLDVRATIETDDGAIVYLYYKGIGECGPDGYKNFLEGAPFPKEGITLRTNPWFQTAHPKYQWLTRGFFLEVGAAYLDRGEVCYDIYQVK